MFFYLLAAIIVAIDQLVKFFVDKLMYVGQSLPFLGGILKLTYVRNTGAAFSLFVGFSSYLAIIALIIVLAVIYFHHRNPEKRSMAQVGLALVLGGSLGNLLDRIFRGYVIDYLDLTVWPVFNLADMMINLGVILIIIKMLKQKHVSDPD